MITSFAKRYLLQSKNTKAIQIIAWVSISAIAVGTAALITVLSVFNGIEGFIKTLYTNFYTDVKITSNTAQPFTEDATIYNYLQAQKNIVSVGKSLEENVLLTATQSQSIVTLKGVDQNYASITKLNDIVKYGDTNIFIAEPRLHVGISIANRMGISEQTITPISIYTFKNEPNGNLQEAYTEASFFISGVFAVQEEFDNKYCITSLATMQKLLATPNTISAYEVKCKSDKEAELLIATIAPTLQKYQLKAQTRYEQNKTLYYILSSEKWMVFAILTFILLIASFNMVASLSVLVLEKKRDIQTLLAIGTKRVTIQKIFLFTGLLIGLLGAGIGTLLSLGICFLQAKFKLVKMSGESFLLDAYPVKVVATDIVFVLITVITIALLAAWWPSVKAKRILAIEKE